MTGDCSLKNTLESSKVPLADDGCKESFTPFFTSLQYILYCATVLRDPSMFLYSSCFRVFRYSGAPHSYQKLHRSQAFFTTYYYGTVRTVHDSYSTTRTSYHMFSHVMFNGDSIKSCLCWRLDTFFFFLLHSTKTTLH